MNGLRSLLVALPLLAGCVSVDLDHHSTDRIGLEQLADRIADRDVVFVGEIHGNAAGHTQQAQLLELLFARQPKLVLSMEMLERDDQPFVDDFLAGRITEQELIDGAGLGAAFADRYAPMVRFAKARSLPVVAGNLPREIASRIAKEGIGALAGTPYAALATTAPEDAYWIEFQAAMGGHAGVDSMRRFYEAQCAKDDAMAESIAGWLRATDGEPTPLVVHIVGGFHVKGRLGTVERVVQRVPQVEIAVVQMQDAPNIEPSGDDFVMHVPAQPEMPKPATESAPAGATIPTTPPTGG